MSARNPARRRSPGRRLFRAFRIGVLLLLLVVAAAGGYLSEVGVPDFLKRPLVNKLRARGVDLQFSRLRLRWYRGLVAENVRIGRAGAAASDPQFSAREAEMRLNPSALAKFELTVDSLALRDGQLAWTLEETNEPSLKLSATNIQAQLRFLPNDEWELDQFTAVVAGARLRVSGSVTNASALRDWKIFQPGPGTGKGLTKQRLRELAKTLEQIKFAGTPELIINASGDARDEQSFHGLITLSAPGAETPWGTLTRGALIARLTALAAATNRPRVAFQLRADDALTTWGGATKLQLNLNAVTDEADTNRVRARLEGTAALLTTQKAQAANVQVTAEWMHELTNPIPAAGTIELHLAKVQTSWGGAGPVRLGARLETPANGPQPDTESWAEWAKLEPYWLDWDFDLKNVHVQDDQLGTLDLQELATGGRWRAPDLEVTNLHARFYEGGIDGHASVNVATRVLTFEETSDFDAKQATQKLTVMTDGARRWLEQYGWEKPPLVHGMGGLVLPSWTNHAPDWRGEVLPTLWLTGDLKAGNAAFRGVPMTSAQFHFSYTNMNWNLPDMVAMRPEGKVEMTHEADDRTRQYYFRIHSTMDITALRGLLETNGQKVLDALKFTTPPEIDAEIRGKWRAPEQTGVKARVAISNFTYRGETATLARTELQYTNRFLQLIEPRIERPEGQMTATAAGVDFTTMKLYLTNGLSTMEPAPFFRVIGPKVSRDLEPYRFRQPPTVRANGIIPLDNGVDGDVHFQIDGGPFNWMKFNLEHVSAGLDWVEDRMSLTDVKASAYGGTLAGEAKFDFKPNQGTDFTFDLTVVDANLQTLMADLSTKSNHLEGQLSGRLVVTHANSTEPQSWFGYGQASLRDGLIWEFPVFGIVSPVLDGVSDGLGKTRANGGTATFVITNSVIRSEDLEIEATTYTMRYWGVVDFESRVDATMEAKVLGRTPFLGQIIGIVLTPLTKLFEVKITGTLAEPKREQVVPFIPKLLMMPFSPIQTIKEIMPTEKPPDTAPPVPKKTP